MTVLPEPYPPGTEPATIANADEAHAGNVAGVDVKQPGEELSKIWNDQYPGLPGSGAPVASFTYSPYPAGQTVNTTFTSTSTPGDAPITSYAWLFDNSATRSGPVVTWRTPNGAGDYPATLTVMDDLGRTDTSTQVLSI